MYIQTMERGGVNNLPMCDIHFHYSGIYTNGSNNTYQ